MQHKIILQLARCHKNAKIYRNIERNYAILVNQINKYVGINISKAFACNDFEYHRKINNLNMNLSITNAKKT